MKSAYLTLGVPGNASEEDIKTAYTAAMAFFTKERMVSDPSLLQRRQEVMNAYKVLTDRDARQAHDRKLARPTPSRDYAASASHAESGQFRWLIPLLGIVLTVFAFTQYVSNKREAQQQQQRATLEAQERQRADEQQRQENERLAEETARKRAELVDQRRRDWEESSQRNVALRDAQSARQQSHYNINQELQRQRNEELAAERARATRANEEARRQREAEYNASRQRQSDAAQLRNLCMINHGRPNC